jgi:hypothetical protein
LMVVAATLVGCNGSGEPSDVQPGSSPRSVGGLFLCPPFAPIRAFRDRYFPLTYPNPPPKTVRPERCFSSSGQASRAGYAVAPTPQGDRLIDGVYLVRPSPHVAHLCRMAARKARLPVPCPTLIPGTADDVFCAVGARCVQRGAVVFEGTFAAPLGYIGAQPGQGHLWIIAFDAHSGVWPKDTVAGGSVVGTPRVRGRPGVFLSYPAGSGLNSGHVVLKWRQSGTTYAVSLHGHTALNLLLDRVIAEQLRLVSDSSAPR